MGNGVITEQTQRGFWVNVRDRVLYRSATLGFDLAILIVMMVLLCVSVIAMGGRVRIYQASVLLPLGCMFAAIVMKRVQDKLNWQENVRHILRDWVPFLIIFFIYENLHDVSGQVMGFDFAGHLYRWDELIFGIEPTIWAQKIYSPLLTDIMAASYALYFFFSLFLMFLLTLWDYRSYFRHMAMTHTFAFLMGFLGYVFLPASPPRYFIETLYTDPVKLHGLILFDRLQGAWDGLSVISGGAFPSLHVGISTIALIYAYKYRNLNRTMNIIWYLYLVLITSLWFSTVYLRHHWVIDIFAGWFVAVASYLITVPLMKIWKSLCDRYGLQSF